MLKLDEEFGGVTELEDLKKNNERISTIMNQTIINTGDGNILNTGEKVTIKANISVNKGDKEALQKTLIDSGIAQQDVHDLVEIIDTEEPNKEKGTFGVKVNTWVNKMMGKALDGSWQIGIGAAGSMLADAIQSYYGLK
jgi:hypothetical protein